MGSFRPSIAPHTPSSIGYFAVIASVYRRISSAAGIQTFAAGCRCSANNNTLLPNLSHLYRGVDVCPNAIGKDCAHDPLVRYQ